jgi:hypothetical protein
MHAGKHVDMYACWQVCTHAVRQLGMHTCWVLVRILVGMYACW